MSTNSTFVYCKNRPADTAYGPIGEEYYDPKRHPTCAAFGQASFALLTKHVSSAEIGRDTNICDVGAGRSVVAALLGDRLESVGVLFLVDEAPEMLACSDVYQLDSIRRVVAAASDIDQLATSFDVIVASLGDPYNTEDFWHAVSKALAPEGVCLFTSPSFEWANTFRRLTAGEEETAAFFVLNGGQRRYVPSVILPEEHQARLIEGAGLLVSSIERFPVAELLYVPPKLEGLAASTPVVTLYRVCH